MAKKQLLYDESARRSLFQGVELASMAVRVTLGPKGRYVILDKKWGAPTVTNDGVTIAKELEFEDPFKNMGAHSFSKRWPRKPTMWPGTAQRRRLCSHTP